MIRARLWRLALCLFFGFVTWRSYQAWCRDRWVEFRIAGNGKEITAIAFSPDGTKLAFSSRREPKIHIWDVRTRQKKIELNRRNVTNFLRYTSNGELVGLGPSNDDYARVWDSNGQVLNSYPDAAEFESTMAEFACVRRFQARLDVFEKDSYGTSVVSMIENQSGKLVGSLVFEGLSKPNWLVSPNRHFSALVLEPRSRNVQNERDGKTILLSEDTGEITELPKIKAAEGITVLISPDRAFAAFHERDGNVGHGIEVWNLTSRARTGSVPYRSRYSPPIVRFAPDSKRIAIAGGDYGYDDFLYGRHGSVQIWEVSTMRSLGTLNTVPIVTAIEYAPDGRRLAVGFDDGSIDILDASFSER